MRSARRSGSGVTLPAVGVNRKYERSFHLSAEKNFLQPFVFRRVRRSAFRKVGIFQCLVCGRAVFGNAPGVRSTFAVGGAGRGRSVEWKLSHGFPVLRLVCDSSRKLAIVLERTSRIFCRLTKILRSVGKIMRQIAGAGDGALDGEGRK